MKSKALEKLRELALEDSYVRHPRLPDYVRTIHNYNDRSANGLTRCILDFLKFKGHQAERISSTGRFLDESRVVVDITGSARRIGSGRWIPGTGTRGTADISAIVNGKAIKIEVKMRDKQSEGQKQYQRQVEAAGGTYWLVRSFDEFYTLYMNLV